MEIIDPQIAKLDNENMEDKERRSSSNCEDEEANEDMSLKVVEKVRAMESINDDAISGDSGNQCGDGVDDGAVDVIPYSQEVEFGADPSRTECDPFLALKMEIVNDSEIDEDGNENDQKVIHMKEKEFVEGISAREIVESLDPDAVETTNNIVLRSLLRGPRYFDYPVIRWDSCYNCGEEGHTTVSCTSHKRKKPCFLCGSSEHKAKQCRMGRGCYICKKGGHRAKDCPEKHKGHSPNSKMCLRCGDSEDDIFSCKNDYSHDDLKEIQCYVCKSFGHLCCVNSVDSGPREVSCYRCGLLGHNGLACGKLDGVGNGASSRSSCFKCGEEGHFARQCTNLRVGKRNRESVTKIETTWDSNLVHTEVERIVNEKEENMEKELLPRQEKVEVVG